MQYDHRFRKVDKQYLGILYGSKESLQKAWGLRTGFQLGNMWERGISKSRASSRGNKNHGYAIKPGIKSQSG